MGVGGCGEECGDKSAVRSLEDAEEAMPSCPMSKRWSSFILPRGGSEPGVIFPAKPAGKAGHVPGEGCNERCNVCNQDLCSIVAKLILQRDLGGRKIS